MKRTQNKYFYLLLTVFAVAIIVLANSQQLFDQISMTPDEGQTTEPDLPLSLDIVLASKSYSAGTFSCSLSFWLQTDYPVKELYSADFVVKDIITLHEDLFGTLQTKTFSFDVNNPYAVYYITVTAKGHFGSDTENVYTISQTITFTLSLNLDSTVVTTASQGIKATTTSISYIIAVFIVLIIVKNKRDDES